MFIRSDPPGARLTLNGAEVPGVTPLEIPFDHHGDFAVRLTLEGHEDLDATAPVETPWYAWPPIDLLAELWPVAVKDHHEFDFRLSPEPVLPPLDEASIWHEEVRKRAAELRREVNEGGGAGNR